MQKLKGKAFLEWLICIMEKVKIPGYQFRWSGGAFSVTHKDDQQRCCCAAAQRFSIFAWTIFILGNFLFRSQQYEGKLPHVFLSQSIEYYSQQICGYQDKVLVAFFFALFFFYIVMWHVTSSSMCKGLQAVVQLETCSSQPK